MIRLAPHSVPRRSRLVALPVLLFAATLAAPASAQNYDANCNAVTDEVKNAEYETARAHPILDLFIGAGNKACRLHDMIKNLFSKSDDPDRIEKVTVDSVIDAAKPAEPPEIPGIPSGLSDEEYKKRVERYKWEKRNPNWEAEAAAIQRRLSNAANDKPSEDEAPGLNDQTYIVPPQQPGKGFAIFEPKTDKPATTQSVDQASVNGDGVLVMPGVIERGTFKQGQMEGPGEEVTSDGVWRGGTYQDNKLEGEGFEVRETGGKVELTEATFKDNQPDGVVAVTSDDGSSRRDIWYRAHLAATGETALAGETPEVPDFKTPEQLALEAEQQFHGLLDHGSAASLYQASQRYQDEGNFKNARLGYEAVAHRFPASPLAATAVAQLARLDAQTQSSGQSPRLTGRPRLAGQQGAAPVAGTGSNGASPPSPPHTGSINAGYVVQISNPILPASFYAAHASHDLSFEACKREGDDPALSARVRGLPQGGSMAEGYRNLIFVQEMLLVVQRQCEQSVPGMMAELQQSVQIRNQAIENCSQVASSTDYCLAPYPL